MVDVGKMCLVSAFEGGDDLSSAGVFDAAVKVLGLHVCRSGDSHDAPIGGGKGRERQFAAPWFATHLATLQLWQFP